MNDINHLVQAPRDSRKTDSGDHGSANLQDLSALFTIGRKRQCVEDSDHQGSTKEKKPKVILPIRILLKPCKTVNQKMSESKEIDSSCVSNETVMDENLTEHEEMTHSITPSNDLKDSLNSAQIFKAKLKHIIIVLIITGCVALLYLMLLLFVPDYHRGFFCNDESLMYPFHESTVSHTFLYGSGCLVPIITIVITELLRKFNKIDEIKNPMISGRVYPSWLKHVIKFSSIFTLGAFSNVAITSIMKNSIGRYRPHFISVCQPLISPANTTCGDTFNTNRYVTTFFCSNGDLSTEIIKEMRLSFPSGHASFSVYTMTFAAFYLHYRLHWFKGKASRSAIICLTLTFIAFAFLISLSRISNYHSHWSDVLAGSILGLFICLIIVFLVSNLFKKRLEVRRVQNPILNDCNP